MEASHTAYDELKGRVKVVAGELKERRHEVRECHSKIDMLTITNQSLQDRITHLEAQGMDKDRTKSETQQELTSLRARLADMETKLQKAQNGIDAERIKGEEALAAYKRKAQNSLSVANSRTAAAVQAREEAEMESRAARATADSAMDRVRAAEAKAHDALEEAKTYVRNMEKEVAKLTSIQQELDLTKSELDSTKAMLDEIKVENGQLKSQVQTLSGQFETEQSKTQVLASDLKEAHNRSSELLEEIERLNREEKKLRDELKRITAERKSEESSKAPSSSTNGYKGSSSSSSSSAHMISKTENAEAEATIAMLRRELQDANQAIKELKETLRVTVERNEASNTPMGMTMNGTNPPVDATETMPLFYAMEKQAELTQAQNEIARLANLVGSAESARQEALDAMVEMKARMEQAQSRLMRLEQLGGKAATEEEAVAKLESGKNVNLEYLKNIVLSYLNAKTIQEKKTLLPVIGTVLCLTAEEQKKAMQGLDQGNTTITGSVLGLKWS